VTPWLSIVGLGEDGLDALTPAARALVAGAETLVGGARHLALVPANGATRLTWETPLSRTVEAIASRRGTRVCVLATGDPMWFGIGVTLARRFDPAETTIVPHVGAFTLAAARLGWPLADCVCTTVHGRPLDPLAIHLAPGARWLVLSEDGTTPAALAAWLAARGWGPSRLRVLARMGGPNERRIEGVAESWEGARAIDDLNTIAVECRPGAQARALPATPGLPDDAFVHDGQLTKRELRAVTLAALAPLPGQLLWDVGAGCGSIAIEWLRCARSLRAAAIERDPTRADLIARNAATLGVPALAIVRGEAPAALAGLEPPDAAFVGGGVSQPGLIEACWAALKPGGRLVANAVTLEGEGALAAAQRGFGGTMIRVAVSRLEKLGPGSGWRPLLPVTQWSAVR